MALFNGPWSAQAVFKVIKLQELYKKLSPIPFLNKEGDFFI